MLLHVTSRFVNREIRVTQPCERERYLRTAAKVVDRTDLRALCYALMGNHVHWGVRPGQAPLRVFFQPLHDSFARWMNPRQSRTGPLFADRPNRYSLDDERFAYLVAYIHNNPVRAKVVEDPADCDWTSHRAYIGEAPPPPWLDVEAGLSLAGFDSSPSGRLAFHDFVRAAARKPRDAMWSAEHAVRARTEIRNVLRAPVEVGLHVGERSRFAVLARPNTPVRARCDVSIERVLAAVARELRISVDELRSTARRRDIVAGRRLALLVWYRDLGQVQAKMAASLGISDSAASQLLGSQHAICELDGRARAVVRALRL